MSLKSKGKRTEYARLLLYPLQNHFAVIDMCGACVPLRGNFIRIECFFVYVFVFQEDHP